MLNTRIGGMYPVIGNIRQYWRFMRSLIVAIRGWSEGDWYTSAHVQRMEVRGKQSSSLTSVAKDNMTLEIYEADSLLPDGK